jgi:xanthine dehydrogenase YagS FAD-binding subunit
LAGAQSQGQNAFKIPLARRAVVRALQAATAGTIDNRGGRRGQPEHAA